MCGLAGSKKSGSLSCIPACKYWKIINFLDFLVKKSINPGTSSRESSEGRMFLAEDLTYQTLFLLGTEQVLFLLGTDHVYLSF